MDWAYLIIGVISVIAVVPIVVGGYRWLLSRIRARRAKKAASVQAAASAKAIPSSQRELEAQIMERLMTPIKPPRPKLQPTSSNTPSQLDELYRSIVSLIAQGKDLQDELVERTRMPPSLTLALVRGGPYALLGSRIDVWTSEIDALIATHGLPTRFRTALRIRSRQRIGGALHGAFGQVSDEELADQLDTNLGLLRALASRIRGTSPSDTSSTAI